MKSRFWISVLLTAAGVAFQSSASNGQEAIDNATSVRPQAEGTHEGGTRTLSAGGSAYSRDLIHAGEAGVADLRFGDNSNLNVGPKSSVRLDKFVYDPNKSSGSVAVEATREAEGLTK